MGWREKAASQQRQKMLPSEEKQTNADPDESVVNEGRCTVCNPIIPLPVWHGNRIGAHFGALLGRSLGGKGLPTGDDESRN